MLLSYGIPTVFSSREYLQIKLKTWLRPCFSDSCWLYVRGHREVLAAKENDRNDFRSTTDFKYIKRKRAIISELSHTKQTIKILTKEKWLRSFSAEWFIKSEQQMRPFTHDHWTIYVGLG